MGFSSENVVSNVNEQIAAVIISITRVFFIQVRLYKDIFLFPFLFCQETGAKSKRGLNSESLSPLHQGEKEET